ncbi:hypothetical protein [Streptomyces sp. NPDC047108]|uniref:hypothetical protein n=1 Tax=Streptomyces sp. NPDC047108 TaxID=3155025 RepID=UPI00340D7F53
MQSGSLRVAATAFAATAGILLAGCGGDSEPKDGKIAGAEQGGGGKASKSPSASASAAADRPKIKLPSDLKHEFEWAKTGDKEKDAVLHDTEQYIMAIDMAIAEQDPLHKAYGFYSEGERAAETQKYVQAYVDEKARATGTVRYYDATVTVNGGSSASLVYCEDQGKVFDMYIKTSKVNKTPVTKNSYVLYAAKLRKNELGVWVTEDLNSERGSAKCQS